MESGQTVIVPVLANDSDPDGDALTLTTVTNGAYGAAAVAGQSVTYTANVGIVGADTFAYTVSDTHGATATGTATVTVTAPPVSYANTVKVPRTVVALRLSSITGEIRPPSPAPVSVVLQHHTDGGWIAVARFPLKRVNPTDFYYAKGKRSPSGSDIAAMKDGNTSAFNCRPVLGTPIGSHSTRMGTRSTSTPSRIPLRKVAGVTVSTRTEIGDLHDGSAWTEIAGVGSPDTDVTLVAVHALQSAPVSKRAITGLGSTG